MKIALLLLAVAAVAVRAAPDVWEDAYYPDTATFLPRSSFGAFAINNSRVYLFGGVVQQNFTDNVFFNDLQVFYQKGNEYAFEELPVASGVQPSPRSGVAVVANENYVGVFGGDEAINVAMTGNDVLNLAQQVSYVYQIDINEWIDVTEGGPSPRLRPTTWSDGVYFYVYGGLAPDNTNTYQDLWRFDLDNMQWTQVSNAPPDPLWGAQAVVVDDHVYLYGGFAGTVPQRAVYKVTLSRISFEGWQIVVPSNAPTQFFGGFVHIPGTQVIYLFSGSEGNAASATERAASDGCDRAMEPTTAQWIYETAQNRWVPWIRSGGHPDAMVDFGAFALLDEVTGAPNFFAMGGYRYECPGAGHIYLENVYRYAFPDPASVLATNGTISGVNDANIEKPDADWNAGPAHIGGDGGGAGVAAAPPSSPTASLSSSAWANHILLAFVCVAWLLVLAIF